MSQGFMGFPEYLVENANLGQPGGEARTVPPNRSVSGVCHSIEGAIGENWPQARCICRFEAAFMPTPLLPTPLLQIGLVTGWLILVGGVAEGLKRRTAIDPEITRKIVHIGAGQVILLAWWLRTPTWMGIVAAVLFSAIALLSHRYPILPGINSVGRDSLGTFFYAVSIGLLIAWFWPQWTPQYAALGILVMTWGDGLAALVGQRYGTHAYQLWDTRKSLEGSGTMWAASLVVCLAILGSTAGWSIPVVWMSLGISLLATLLEAFSKYGIDNLTVPVGTAAVAYGLMSWVGG